MTTSPKTLEELFEEYRVAHMSRDDYDEIAQRYFDALAAYEAEKAAAAERKARRQAMIAVAQWAKSLTPTKADFSLACEMLRRMTRSTRQYGYHYDGPDGQMFSADILPLIDAWAAADPEI